MTQATDFRLDVIGVEPSAKGVRPATLVSVDLDDAPALTISSEGISFTSDLHRAQEGTLTAGAYARRLLEWDDVLALLKDLARTAQN